MAPSSGPTIMGIDVITVASVLSAVATYRDTPDPVGGFKIVPFRLTVALS